MTFIAKTCVENGKWTTFLPVKGQDLVSNCQSWPHLHGVDHTLSLGVYPEIFFPFREPLPKVTGEASYRVVQEGENYWASV
ncbi:hypothetical protein CEXT_433881 [Caerostris extrusa]|uniref:Uncharacterized protein n=1 Tax=Caerostris extrusa TaxID=172846 RepID=A0AAV4WAM1_CAEEX|nr:hypothetical protein CEXT_433881 [Caerostris extrusa]